MKNHFFSASQKELQKVLRGWVFPPPPLEKPITVSVKSIWGGEQPYETRLDRSTLPPVAADAETEPRIPRSPSVQNTAISFDELPSVLSTLTGMPLADAENLVLVCGLIEGPLDSMVSVYRLPDALLGALVSAKSADLERAAGELDVGNPSDLAEELDEIKELATKARSSKQDLFVALFVDD